MATSRIATTRNRIKTILQAVTGISSSRVNLGMVQFDSDEEFLQDLLTDGYFVNIEPAVQTAFDIQTKLFDFYVDVTVHFGFAADTDYDFITCENVVYQDIQAAIATLASWTDCSAPNDISIEKPEAAWTKPMSAVYRVRLSFMGGLN